jgi:zinc D-Ala-D-Ala carboxypeptidase
MTALTLHFSLEELTHSEKAQELGIDNTPPKEDLPNLLDVAVGLEKVRALLGGKPMTINSGYRGPELNEAVHGIAHSAHEACYAADFVAPGFGTPLEIVQALATSDLIFDQLIQEGTWVHVSFAPTQRREVLTAHFVEGGTTTYTMGV